MAIFPFMKPIASDIEYFGGISNTRWMWSTCTLPSSICIFFHSHSCRMISLTDLPISPRSILNRYFGHHTTWYLHCHTACANFLNCFIEYLLLGFRATISLFLREVFIFCKSLSYPHSKAWTFSLSEGLRG